MTVAVGRLQMSLSWETRRDRPRSAALARPGRVESAYRREKWAQQVEADRARWRGYIRCNCPWL